MNENNILQVEGVGKIYGGKLKAKTVALTNVNFSVDKGEFVGIMGESGSGKTTLLNLISTLDNPTEGKIFINGRDLSTLTNKDVAEFRRTSLGFVFQDFKLLNKFTNYENIMLPLVLSGVNYKEAEKKVSVVGQKLRITELLNKKPYELSGGQRQRVAIGRAIITEPSLLLADEPTGELDSKSSEIIMNIFTNINKAGQTIMMVTHSVRSASYCNRVLFIRDGKVFHEIFKGDSSNEEFMNKIIESQTMLSRGDK